MGENQWKVVYEANGMLHAEMLRGVLEAQEIPVVLSQEGLGRVYGLTVGPLGRVELLVPVSMLVQAIQILQDYDSGEALNFDFSETNPPDQENPEDGSNNS